MWMKFAGDVRRMDALVVVIGQSMKKD